MKRTSRALVEEQRDMLEERMLFLLLFYRERISRLAGSLIDNAAYKKVIRKKHKKSILGVYDWSTEQVGQFLAEFVRRAEDETRCNNICKSMYFCDKKKGHKGPHVEFIIGKKGLSW